MARYQVSNRWKKSAVDTEIWIHGEDNTKRFMRETGWRWASYLVNLSDEDLEYIDVEDECGEFYPYSYEDCELISADDGCWEEFIFPDNITAEEREAIEQAYNEDYCDGLESLGYYLDDTEVVLSGPLDIELASDDEEDTEITETTADDAPVDATKWPFTAMAQQLAQDLKKKERDE